MGSKGGKTQRGRLPVDDPEGISGQYDRQGNLIPTGAVSTTLTEVIDLISEGEIHGLVTGYWVFSGNIFETGYRTGSFSGYDVPSGTTNSRWMRSIFWNETPVVDSNNKFNFPNIDIKWTPGTENGELLTSTGIDSIKTDGLTVTKIYNERLRAAYTNPNSSELVNDASNQDYAKVYRILNPECVGVFVNVKFGTLQRRNVSEEEYGDSEVTTVNYQIEYRGLFADGSDDGWSTPFKESVKGKITYGYIKSTRINFNGHNIVGKNPPYVVETTNKIENTTRRDFLGWEIRITRTTPDSTTSLVSDQSYLDSITEIYQNKFLYPNSAMVRNTFNAEYFAQVPTRSYDTNLLKIKIPANYDPILKSYSGEWDGTFALEKQWSDNPAWCFYDLVTNNRYGLGKYIDEANIDKWTLYKAGQYCDVLVPDGFGKLEPRFTCNTIINSREDAFKVINDFASIFRSIAYYSVGSLNVMQDAKVDTNSEVFQLFTNSNVENGNFNYTTSPQSSRASVAIVRYNDKNNLYKPAIEYIEDIDAIKRYGIREREMTAFGCTSRGQAIRYGKWALLTENRQYESISFTAATEGMLLSPGDVIKVYDRNRNFNKRLAGRARFVSGNIIDLDSNIRDIIATGSLTGEVYKLSLSTPTYNYNLTGLITGSSLIPGIHRPHIQYQNFTGRSATGLISGITRITMPSSWDFTNYNQIKNPVWMIESTGNPNFIYEPEFWKVLNIEEERNNKYNIFGIKYDDDKYNLVDSGLATITYTYSAGNPSCPTPSSLLLSGYSNSSYTNIINYSWQMPNLNNVDGYKIQILKDNIELSNFTTKTPNIMSGNYPLETEGSYTFKVWATNGKGSLSLCNLFATTGFYDIRSKIDGIRLAGLFGPFTKSGIDPSETNESNRDKLFQSNPESLANPTFYWDYADTKGYEGDNGSQLYWRVSIRRPSDTFQPSPIYYWQQTGLILDPRLGYDGFTLDTNTSIVLPDFINGKVERPPYRIYDIVVEGHDENGNSSAGGNFTTNINTSGLRDSSYTNAIGWDIMTVSNPAITGLFLYTGYRPTSTNYQQSFNSGAFHIDAWINDNGMLNLNFLTGKYTHPDYYTTFIYFSGGNNRFTTGAAFSGFVDYAEYPFGSLESYPTLWSDIPLNQGAIAPEILSGYLAISISDVFDANRTDIAYRTGIEISNVIPIFRRNSSFGPITNTANAGSATLPANPVGFISMLMADNNGISGVKKIPFYN